MSSEGARFGRGCAIFALLSAAGFAAVEAPPTRSSSALRAYNQGVQQANAGRCREAIPFLSDAISDDRDFADAYYARGYCRQLLKSAEAAAMDLSDAVRLNPGLLEARSLRGAVRLELDQSDAALEDFNYVLARRPTDSTSLLERGVIFLKRDDLPSAKRDLQAFVKHHADHPMAGQARKVLASMGVAAAPGAEAREPSQPRVRRPEAAEAAGGHVSAAALEEAKALLAGDRSVSGQVGRKVLRGERSEAVGNIGTAPSAPSRRKGASGDIEIVTPH